MPLRGVNLPKLALGSLSGAAFPSLPLVESTPREVSGGLDTSLASANDTELGWLMGTGFTGAAVSPTAAPKLTRLSNMVPSISKAAEPTPRQVSGGLDTSVASADDSELGWLTSTKDDSHGHHGSATPVESREGCELRTVAEAEEYSFSSDTTVSDECVRETDSGAEHSQSSLLADSASQRQQLEVSWNENAVGSSPRSSCDAEATTPVAIWHHGQWTVFSLGATAFKQITEGDSDSSASPACSNISAMEAFDRGLENASVEDTDWLGNGQINTENILETPKRSRHPLRHSDSLPHSPLRPSGVLHIPEFVGENQIQNAGTEAECPAVVSSVKVEPEVPDQLHLAPESPSCDTVIPAERFCTWSSTVAELAEPSSKPLALGALQRSHNASDVQLMVELTECQDDEGDWLTSGENTPMSVVDPSQLKPPRVSVGGESEEHWLPSGDSPRSPLITSNEPSEHPGSGEGRCRSSRLQVAIPKSVAAEPHNLSSISGSDRSPLSSGRGPSSSLSSSVSPQYLDRSDQWSVVSDRSMSTPGCHGLDLPTRVAQGAHQLVVTATPCCSQSTVSPSGRISPNPRGTSFLRIDQQRCPPSKIPEPCEGYRSPLVGAHKLPDKFLEQYLTTPSRIPQPFCGL